MYFPDRVMRQFGMLQEEPVSCDTSLALHALDRRGRVGTRWDVYHREHIAAWEDRRNRIITTVPFTGRISPDDQYMRWYRTISRTPIGPLRDVPLIGPQPVAATRTILVETAVRATQIAVDILSCTDWDEVRRMAELMRSIGRRTIVAIDEEHRLANAATTTSAETRPSSPSGAGPSSSARVGPSTSTGVGPSTSLGVSPSTSSRPPSSDGHSHHPLASIDDYTIVMDDVDTTQTPSVEATPLVRTPSPVQDDTVMDRPLQQYRRKRPRARVDPAIQPPFQFLDDPPPQPLPVVPQTQPQVQEIRKNPPRTKKVPSCGTG